MKILLVNPKNPNTFWSFNYALKFISKKASHPPLGLLTVASMLPEEWDIKLIDMNVNSLSRKDMKGVDLIFIGGMSIQKASAKKVIEMAKEMNVKVVAGGPLFTTEYKEFDDVDYLVLNEAEVTLPLFLKDLETGNPQHIYTTGELPALDRTPLPMWSLIDMSKYATMGIQYSRGCPFDCEFCDITFLYGHRVRTKSAAQIVSELEHLYRHGWRGGVFFVDDNFIGNRLKLKKEVLPSIAGWMEERGYPYHFNTEASIDLSDDDELMEMMIDAGFESVFVGIESPSDESLAECNKLQNRNRDLVESVRKIQMAGIQVFGGFIVGFDSDSSSIFDRIVSFIQDSKIVTAMVGLLNAPHGTRLYKRMVREGRLLGEITGDNTDFSMNFVPAMDKKLLLDGFSDVVNRIYSPKYYYERVKGFLKDYKLHRKRSFHFKFSDLSAFIKSIFLLGIKERERSYYWKLFFWSLFRKPQLVPLAITYTVYGYHFRKVYEDYSLNLK